MIKKFSSTKSLYIKFALRDNNKFMFIYYILLLIVGYFTEGKNEIRKYPHPRSNETIESVAKRWGSLYGYNAAEAFEIIMMRISNFNNFY